MIRLSIVIASLFLSGPTHAEETCVYRGNGECWTRQCPGATLDHFEKIYNRMSIFEVREVFACSGQLVSRSNAGMYGRKSEIWKFPGKASGTGLLVRIENHRVVETLQVGLE